MKNQSTLILRRVLFFIIYLFAILGIIKNIGLYITKKIYGENINEVSIIIQFIIYLVLILISIWCMFPMIKDDISCFKKSYINDVLSIQTVACIILAIAFVILSVIQPVNM